eukprot:TRINITY_DN61309_c0_g1_i1.p1 TRINITY_DN61309_c0_g1~~TRINITY_DN61309_c0_g1_i1.p1  ORF type:complete len:476 (+),score=41.01 TRINITY_DN61309_c0_g1_i1:119-1546(+)
MPLPCCSGGCLVELYLKFTKSSLRRNTRPQQVELKPFMYEQKSCALVELVGIEDASQSYKVFGACDVYVIAKFDTKRMPGFMRYFPLRCNSASPVWCSKRVFPYRFIGRGTPDASEALRLEVHYVGHRGEACQTASILVKEIEGRGFGETLSIKAQVANTASEQIKPCTISVRVWPGSIFKSWPTTKWIFIIRHAESEWNEAQRSKNLQKLLHSVDHGLSSEGFRQALRLGDLVKEALDNRDTQTSLHDEKTRFFDNRVPHLEADSADTFLEEDVAEQNLTSLFLETDVLLSSPLKRALQTALAALRYHPVAGTRGIRLQSDAREVRSSAASVDTGSRSRGVDIVNRVLDGMCKHSAHDMPDLGHIPVDVNDTEHEWWNSAKEDSSDVRARISELLVQLKFCPERTFVLIGHSLLYRQLVKHFAHKSALASCPLLVDLQNQKVGNCGVVALRLSFNNDVSECITYAKFLFGTTLK